MALELTSFLVSPASIPPLAGRSDDALSGGVGVGAKRLTPPGDPG